MTRADSALRALLLLLPLLPLLGPDPAASAALPELQARLSGVERLLGGFGRQLQQERPREEPEPETQPRAQERCPGAGGGLAQLRDAIIRTQDSLAAGASYLRAPEAVRGWRQCVAACCAEPRCSVAVVEQPAPPGPPALPDAALGCYLFDCTARGRSVCRFAPHRGYSSYSLRRAPERGPGRPSPPLGKDEPPVSEAGQDMVLHLPTDGVILDGRRSTDDHGISQYTWMLLQGDPSVDMKVPQSGILKLSHLREGKYDFELTVMDTAGQSSSDNVSVTVLPAALSPGGCLSVCSRYDFFCDNGCCIDITLACNGVEQCPDGSDEAFCQNLDFSRKTVTHTATASPRTLGPSKDKEWTSLLEQAPKQPPALPDTERRNHSTFWSSGTQIRPVTSGAVLPLALGLAITALLLLLVACRLRLVKQKLKKARPITSEESDYLINGMYL
ncbi:low-density lipoprotein receptor-related protein 11 isoform X2 [Suncus etruscus]|uniref:low-density lipoprotein receptor-related protein 11 isoform X2 n=1 Tax=Suncus etruscus TaxID=109475 RepID=UPI0021103C53|nr:low-density lipoprotein receptor-related protein 11 isoform X2 [Suncus etruscus]